MKLMPRLNTGLSALTALAAVAAATTMAASSAFASAFMPPAVTAIAGEVDQIYAFLLITSFISFVMLIGGMFYFVYKYQRRSANDKTAYISHNYMLEFLWSFIPFLIFMFVFVWGWKVYHDMRNVPAGALEIHVMAKKWDWRFIYKSGKEAVSGVDANGQKTPATMVVPIGRPVKLIMGSEKINAASTDRSDRPVLHSFYLPAARIKQDIVPGRYTTQWFNIEKAGDYWVFCTEFCGGGHSSMKAVVKAVPVEEFEAWLASEGGGSLSLVDQGRNLYAAKACIGCHSADGSSVVGPTFKGLFGKSRSFVSGKTATADEDYLRDSILNPNANVVTGYPAGVMPAYAGQLSDDEVNAIIEFIKTLK